MTVKEKAKQLLAIFNTKEGAIACAIQLREAAWWQCPSIMKKPYRSCQKEFYEAVIKELQNR